MAKLLLKLAVSSILLALLLWRVPLGEIGTHLRSLEPTAVVGALALSLGAWVVAAARLWCLLPEFRYRDLLGATFVAKFYGTVLPGQIAGDLVKAYRLGRQASRMGHVGAATALDRGLGLFALFLVSAIATIWAPHLPLALRLFFVFGTVGMAAGGAVAGSRLFRTAIVERFLSRRRGRIGGFMRDFSVALHDSLRRPRQLVAAVVLSVVFHGACIWFQVILGEALNIRLRWADWTIVYAGVSLLMVLPISIAGLGLREGGYVGLLALFGYKASVALSLSFAMLGVSLGGTLVGGVLELVTMVQRSHATSKHAKRSPDRL